LKRKIILPLNLELKRKKSQKKRAKKDPEAPKGAKNSYLLFCEHEKEAVKEETELEGKELRAELTSRWNTHKENKDDIFEKYQTLAAEEKERVKIATNAYKATKNVDEEELEEPKPAEEKPKKTVSKKIETEQKLKKTAAKGKKVVYDDDE
jgi:hypothetical protein